MAADILVLGEPATPRRQSRPVVRHVGGDRVVALIEIVSPANKDRSEHVENFVFKVVEMLQQGVHVLMLDLFPPGPHDPDGLHPAIIAELALSAGEPSAVPTPSREANRPLSFVAYRGGAELEAFAAFRAVGETLPVMPLFLSEERYVNVPFEESHQRAWAGTPARWRRVLDPSASPGDVSEA